MGASNRQNRRPPQPLPSSPGGGGQQQDMSQQHDLAFQQQQHLHYQHQNHHHHQQQQRSSQHREIQHREHRESQQHISSSGSSPQRHQNRHSVAFTGPQFHQNYTQNHRSQQQNLPPGTSQQQQQHPMQQQMSYEKSPKSSSPSSSPRRQSMGFVGGARFVGGQSPPSFQHPQNQNHHPRLHPPPPQNHHHHSQRTHSSGSSSEGFQKLPPPQHRYSSGFPQNQQQPLLPPREQQQQQQQQQRSNPAKRLSQMPVATPPAAVVGATPTPIPTGSSTIPATTKIGAASSAPTNGLEGGGPARATKTAAIERWLRDTPLPPNITTGPSSADRRRSRSFSTELASHAPIMVEKMSTAAGNVGEDPCLASPSSRPMVAPIRLPERHMSESQLLTTNGHMTASFLASPRTSIDAPPHHHAPQPIAPGRSDKHPHRSTSRPGATVDIVPQSPLIKSSEKQSPSTAEEDEKPLGLSSSAAARASILLHPDVVKGDGALGIAAAAENIAAQLDRREERRERRKSTAPATVAAAPVPAPVSAPAPTQTQSATNTIKPGRTRPMPQPPAVVMPAVNGLAAPVSDGKATYSPLKEIAPSFRGHNGQRTSSDAESIMDGRQMLGKDYAESTNSNGSDFISPKVLLTRPHHRESLIPSGASSVNDNSSESGISFGGESATLDGVSSDVESDLGSMASSAMAGAPLIERMEIMKQRTKRAKDKQQSFEACRFIIDNVQYLEKAEQKPYCELAIKQLKKLSITGIVDAQYLLANLYISGIPGFQDKHKPDYTKAFNLYLSASKKDHSEALFHVGLCYEQGAGVGQSNARALHNYRKAAVSNHPGAMFRLGMSLLKGELGQNKHPRDGVKWLKLAAKYATEKYPQALYELALLHDRGVHNVVWPDHDYLVELLTQGAALGHGGSQFKLGEAYEYGNYEVTIDAGRSVYYYSLAAANGSLEAMFELGGWYLTGADDPKTDFHLIQSDTEAHRWVSLAADGGLPKAMFAMGYFCEMGIGTGDKNMDAAVQWYRSAAAEGDTKAKKKLEELGVTVPAALSSPKNKIREGSMVGSTVSTAVGAKSDTTITSMSRDIPTPADTIAAARSGPNGKKKDKKGCIVM